MLAMSTVLKRTEPFKTIFGYALVFGEDGRPMHKSWGNAIEFDEAADRMGVDVMRWMFAKARPEDNILFGWHAADEARRELLVLWNVYAFFVTYARLDGWTPRQGIGEAMEARDGEWPVLDRWILSRAAGLAAAVGARLADFDAIAATRAISAFIDDLSTWYLRRSRDRMRAGADHADRDAAFATLHAALVSLSRTIAPILPFLSETLYGNLVASVGPDAARQRPPDELAGRRHGAATATSRWSARWPSSGAPSTSRGRCGRRRVSGRASRSRRRGSPCPTAGSPSTPSSSSCSRTSSTSSGSR